MPTSAELDQHVSAGAHSGGGNSSASFQDANNLIYQAIREHKQKEMERQASVLLDNQSITETMIRKRREADENKSVITASSFYANNAQYVTINSGRDPRIKLSPCIHPLNPDECDVYISLVEAVDNSTICASMNHHISESGEIEGFRFTCSGRDMANCMPISRRMFFMHSMVECEMGAEGRGENEDEEEEEEGPSESRPWNKGSYVSFMEEYNTSLLETNRNLDERSTKRKPEIGLATAAILSSRACESVPRPLHQQAQGERESSKILNLLLRQNEVRKRLLKLVQTIYKESVGFEANFSCIPENSDILDNAEHVLRMDPMALFGTVHNRKASDCKNWKPEMPETVGIYHAYVRGFNKDTRSHKLFILTSGGCTSMSDSYFNLFVDIRNHMTVADVANSEETWFLRNACRRNNCRILLEVAKEFNLDIPTVTDNYSHDRVPMASCTTETMCYDIVQEKYGRYSVSNQSVDTTRSHNGVLCSMHPSEGVWLFKGPVQTSSAMSLYGGSFGVGCTGSAFPVSTTKVHNNYSWKSKSVPGSGVCNGTPCTVESKDGRAVARVDCNGALVHQSEESYTYIDENYIQSLQEDCRWNRDNGIIELIPIAVVKQQ